MIAAPSTTSLKQAYNDEENVPNKLDNYHHIIDTIMQTVKNTFQINNSQEWKLVEENQNFTIYLKFENKFVWSSAKANIISPYEKVSCYGEKM